MRPKMRIPHALDGRRSCSLDAPAPALWRSDLSSCGCGCEAIFYGAPPQQILLISRFELDGEGRRRPSSYFPDRIPSPYRQLPPRGAAALGRARQPRGVDGEDELELDWWGRGRPGNRRESRVATREASSAPTVPMRSRVGRVNPCADVRCAKQGPCLVEKNLQNFSDSPSHRIFRCMHEVLNIYRNKN